MAGIPIRLHFTFLLFLVWDHVPSPGQANVVSVLFVPAIFACVVLRELGHSIVALRCGILVSGIPSYPTGGTAWNEKRPTMGQDLRGTVAGLAVNVIFAILRAIGFFAVRQIVASRISNERV